MKNIDIEFYSKNQVCFLILTGIGGTTKGYQNKYEIIAKKVIKDYGFSVAVATTPQGSWEYTKDNLDYIIHYLRNKEIKKIYAMGTSAGGNILLMHSYLFPEIEKILAINPVLNINFHKIEDGIKEYKGKVKMICGEKDMSSQFVKLLDKEIDKIILQDIDHNFTNALETFIALPFNYFI